MIRKFEQDAIVNQIMEGVSEKADKQIEKAKKSADYKAIVKMTEKLTKLKEQRDAMSKALAKEELEVNHAISNYNTMSENGVYCISGIATYKDSYELDWTKFEWKVKDKIRDKLAIALLEPNAQTRVKDIIMAIVNEVAK
mgnify:FL=1|tara:strand:- start:529 stop:948 length:420 start_codon:yes stop_codon:yes gene_type:complete